MHKKLLNTFILFFTLLIMPTILGCKKQTLILKDASISEDTKFKGAIVDIAIEDFNELGFELGDSCNILFSNNYELKDVPYYNGYYVRNGDPLIVAYPGNSNIMITLNNIGIWNEANLKNTYTVTITLNAKKKYISTQEALSQNYSFDRSMYSSDQEFTNFRSLAGGTLKENLIFRGASPVDNSRNRAKYTDELLKENNIKCIIDLADSLANMKNYINSLDFNSNYTKSIFENDDIILLSMGSNYGQVSFMQSVVKGLKFMLYNDGPYYIHCMEGKDRTGFVCMLIEALFGASYDEMCTDYMQTYQNYYKISPVETKDKYDAIVSLYFNGFLEILHGTDDVGILKNASFIEDAKIYLRMGSMTDNEINAFIKKFSK